MGASGITKKNCKETWVTWVNSHREFLSASEKSPAFTRDDEERKRVRGKKKDRTKQQGAESRGDCQKKKPPSRGRTVFYHGGEERGWGGVPIIYNRAKEAWGGKRWRGNLQQSHSDKEVKEPGPDHGLCKKGRQQGKTLSETGQRLRTAMPNPRAGGKETLRTLIKRRREGGLKLTRRNEDVYDCITSGEERMGTRGQGTSLQQHSFTATSLLCLKPDERREP